MAISAFRMTAQSLLMLTLCAAASAQAAQPDSGSQHWITVWATSPVLYQARDEDAPFAFSVNSPAPSTVPARAPDSDLNGKTLREIVRISSAVKTVRLRFTNEFGSSPVVFGDATVGLAAGQSAIQNGSLHRLTFNGRPSVTIPAGALVYSDPVALEAPAFTNLSVSIFIENQAGPQTLHYDSRSTNYIATGNQASATDLQQAWPLIYGGWKFFNGIESEAARDDASVIAFGDSITDGALSTSGAYRRWPDRLAERLQADGKLKHLAVVNEGIGGNRILYAGYGQPALARFDRDVLAQSGAKYVILLEGINDIGALNTQPGLLSLDDLIFGMKQIIERAHAHGLLIFGGTLTAYKGAKYSTPEGVVLRDKLNEWIRTSHAFDGVIDFDAATRGTTDPENFAPEYDSGDHLHPHDPGYKAMGETIDLKLFSNQ